MKKNNYSVSVGLILFVLYVVQFIIGFNWSWLEQFQLDESYKRWSGFALGLLILFQWLLTFVRVIKRFRIYSEKITTFHKWLGALSPLFFYFHSTTLGYGYLLLLSYIFLFNVLIGNLNLDIIKSTNEWVFKLWMIIHVLLSIVITVLMFFHIGVVFYYK